jgi:Bacterial pre-peptidase C-terminal domain
VFSTYGSSTEAAEPNHCGTIGGASQWFSYQAEADGILRITTDGSDFDTVLAVYEGSGESFDTLTAVACDDNSGADGVDSAVQFSATGGKVYFVAVDGVNGANGNAQLSYQLTPPLRLSSVAFQGGGFRLQITGRSGGAYTLEGSLDLVSWTPLLTTNAPAASFTVLDLAAENLPYRFYRSLEAR